jgi:hypothetical protein
MWRSSNEWHGALLHDNLYGLNLNTYVGILTRKNIPDNMKHREMLHK